MHSLFFAPLVPLRMHLINVYSRCVYSRNVRVYRYFTKHTYEMYTHKTYTHKTHIGHKRTVLYTLQYEYSHKAYPHKRICTIVFSLAINLKVCVVLIFRGIYCINPTRIFAELSSYWTNPSFLTVKRCFIFYKLLFSQCVQRKRIKFRSKERPLEVDLKSDVI
jgi:hypothetical protein